MVVDEMLRRLTNEVIGFAKTDEQKIPTERELAERLGVNRTSLRERLTALEVLGVVRRTQGSGTYLDMPHSTFVRLYFELGVRLGHVQIDQLEQAREMIEREVVREAAIRITAEDLAVLERHTERMLCPRTVEEGDQADHEFHLQLFRAARNPVMVLIAEGLSSVLQELLQRRRIRMRRVPESAERTNAVHLPLLDALRDRDSDAAVDAMDKHFQVWREESAKIAEAEVLDNIIGESEGGEIRHESEQATRHRTGRSES